MNSTYSKYEERILSVLDSLVENRQNLKTPIESLLEHIHALGIVGDEKQEVIRSAVLKVLDECGEKVEHIDGAYKDLRKIGSILKDIFFPSKSPD
jgi:trimethylamine:corrinoid methyltransferase-like protein